MPIYRCFCRTVDERIITGARIEASDLQGVLAAAWERWKDMPGFHDVEIWQGERRLLPASEPAAGLVAAWPAEPSQPYAALSAQMTGLEAGTPAWSTGSDPASVAAVPDTDRDAPDQQEAGQSCTVAGRPDADGRAEPQDSREECLKSLPFQFVMDGPLGQWSALPASPITLQVLAHDLSEPLTAILNYLQLSRRLVDEPASGHSAELTEAVSRAIEQANRASALVRQLRSVSTASCARVPDLV